MDDKLKDYGKPYPHDPNFRGPHGRRSCTDVIFVFIFIVFVGCYIGVSIYAGYNGSIKSVLAPRDMKGRRCGIDLDVINKPYLLFFDLTKCVNLPFVRCNTPQVCVESCPTTSFVWDAVERSNSFNPNDMICQDGYRPRNKVEAQKLIQDNRCARWYLPSNSVQMRCLPIEDSSRINSDVSKVGTYAQEVNLNDISKGKKVVEVLSDARETATKIISDIYDSWQEFLLYSLVSVIVSLIIIFLLRWFAGLMTWTSILAVMVLFAYGIYFFVMRYIKFQAPRPSNDILERTRSSLDTKNTWLILSIVTSVLLLIILLLVIFLRKRIVLAIAIFEETSKSVLSNFMALFFPIIPWALHVLVFAFALYVGLNLASIDQGEHRINKDSESECKCTGEAASYQNGSICKPDIFNKYCRDGDNPCVLTSCLLYKEDKLITYLHVFNLFGFLWLTAFIGALGEMVLAGTFAAWYWTFKKDALPSCGIISSLIRTLRFHIGTLAFGSLILAICRMIRITLEYISKKLSLYDNCFVRAILCCLKCFFWCLENFIKFMNRNAYIMCAMHGNNFCSSAKDAFNLLMRNPLRAVVINKVTGFLVFINKLVIVGLVSTLAYWVSFREEMNNSLNYNWIPVVIVGIITFIIASTFFSVFVMGVDTLFLCFLEDGERNDGTPEKPYFMSKNLMKVLGKKNN